MPLPRKQVRSSLREHTESRTGEAREGPLAIADISGYTAFVAGTELEHAREILKELIEVTVRSLTAGLRVVQIEGDAVFCVGQQMDAGLLDLVEASFIAFHRRLREIQAVTRCPCAACVSVSSLTLKFVFHYGRYLPHPVAKTELLLGADVNLTHRLLKNSVPSHEYVLATTAVLDRLPAERRGRFVAHSESYPDVGTVRAGYADLAALRQRVDLEPRARVAPPEARLRFVTVLEAPLADVWRALVDPEARRRWLRAQRIDFCPGARGTLHGAEYRGHHGTRGEEQTAFRIVGVEEPRELTVNFTLPPAGDVYWTQQLTAEGAQRTRLETFAYWKRPPGLVGLLADLLAWPFARRSTLRAHRIMREILAERTAAVGSAA